MWGSGPDERLRRQPSSGPANQWHTVGDGEQGNDRRYPTHPTEAVEGETPENISRYQSGTWGERDAGGFDELYARENFETLRKDLTELGRVRSKDAQTLKLQRTISATSRRSKNLSRPGTRHTATSRTAEESEAGDLEAGPEHEKEEDEFVLDQVSLGDTSSKMSTDILPVHARRPLRTAH